MEKKKKKKKKLTLSISSSKTHNVPRYTRSDGKTSVVIEKKAQRRWGERKFQSQNNNINKPKLTGNFVSKKPVINKNFDIRRMAEERATRRFESIKEDIIQQKKSNLGKEKRFISKMGQKWVLYWSKMGHEKTTFSETTGKILVQNGSKSE